MEIIGMLSVTKKGFRLSFFTLAIGLSTYSNAYDVEKIRTILRQQSINHLSHLWKNMAC
jgi:hypothetical protein